jgi:hypothetical protein
MFNSAARPVYYDAGSSFQQLVAASPAPPPPPRKPVRARRGDTWRASDQKSLDFRSWKAKFREFVLLLGTTARPHAKLI